MTKTNKNLLLIAAGLLITILFGGAATTQASTASFVRMDTSTQGTWQGVYGGDGYSLADSSSTKIPAYASVSPENEANWIWTANSSDARAMQIPGGGRLASCWYTGYGTFDVNINFTDGNTHQVAIYALDWDNQGRSETIQVLDATTNAVLSTQSIASFSNGTYLIWNISGHVKIQATRITGPNAVISGILFQPTTSSTTSTTTSTGATAAFLNADTSTHGSWHGVYGVDGHAIAQDSPAVPSYASLNEVSNMNWTWAQSTSDTRAPVITAGTTRMASAWFSPSNFTLDLNLTDGKTHQIAIYALDWDSQNRAESVRVLDANSNAVLDSRSVFSFQGGTYLVWNLTGHVKIVVSCSSGPNAVVSGIFFGAGSATSGTNTSTGATQTQPTTTNTSTTTSSAPTTPSTTSNTTTSNTGTSNTGTTSSSTSSTSSSSSTTTSSSTSSTSTTPAVGQLTVTPASYSFGNVNVGSSMSQTFSVKNIGTASVTFSSVSISGAGFNATGLSNGVVLAAGQTATVSATYAPAASGAATGSITLKSNASNTTLAISLSGSGVQVTHSVDLTWAPSNSSSIVGYNVYRGSVSGGPYTMLTNSVQPSTNYTDSGVQSGQTYYYVVTSVDSTNVQSSYSTPVTVAIP